MAKEFKDFGEDKLVDRKYNKRTYSGRAFRYIPGDKNIIGDAEDMESAIVTNQNALSYWTNFDVPTDYVALLLYLGALTCLVLGVMALGNEEEEAKDDSSETAEAESSDAEEAETTE